MMTNKIEVPLCVLRLHLTLLLDDLHESSTWSHLLETPSRLDATPFDNRTYYIVGAEHHSAFMLGAEVALRDRSFQPDRLVNSTEWDLEEYAYEILAEWRRRWWRELAIPEDWIARAVLTDESMESWNGRLEARDSLPPYIPLRARDVRASFGRMGWTASSPVGDVQVLTGQRTDLSFTLPLDDVLLERAAVKLAFAWRALENSTHNIQSVEQDELESLIDAFRKAGLTGCTSMLEGLRNTTHKPQAAAQLHVAQALLEAHQAEPSTSQP